MTITTFTTMAHVVVVAQACMQSTFYIDVWMEAQAVFYDSSLHKDVPL
jgi:hypothetical protein